MAYGSRLGGDGCHPVDGCGDGDPYHGATFHFLAANVRYKTDGQPIFAPYGIHHFNGVKVGIVGMTLEDTPTIVTPDGIKTVDFLDEAGSVNALVPELKRQGVETILVLLHEGGSMPLGGTPPGPARTRRRRSTAVSTRRARCRRSSSGCTRRSTSSSPATRTGP